MFSVSGKRWGDCPPTNRSSRWDTATIPIPSERGPVPCWLKRAGELQRLASGTRQAVPGGIPVLVSLPAAPAPARAGVQEDPPQLMVVSLRPERAAEGDHGSPPCCKVSYCRQATVGTDVSPLLQRMGTRRWGPAGCGVSGVAAAAAFLPPGSWAPHFTGTTLKMAAKAKCWGIHHLKAQWGPRMLSFEWREGAHWAVSQPCSPQLAHGRHLGGTVFILKHSLGLWAMAGVRLELVVLLSACGWCVCHSTSALCGNHAFH